MFNVCTSPLDLPCHIISRLYEPTGIQYLYWEQLNFCQFQTNLAEITAEPTTVFYAQNFDVMFRDDVIKLSNLAALIYTILSSISNVMIALFSVFQKSTSLSSSAG